MPLQVFLTGATGYIGGSILHEIVQNHKDKYVVTALVRSQANASRIEATGAKTLVGSYNNPELLVKAAREYDVRAFSMRTWSNDMITVHTGRHSHW